MYPVMSITQIAGERHRLEAAAVHSSEDYTAWPTGLLSRTCLAADEGLTVVDVWESRLALGGALESGALRQPWRRAGARSVTVRVTPARTVNTRPTAASGDIPATAA